MDASYFDDRNRLEDAFFADQDNKIVHALREQRAEKMSFEALKAEAAKSGINDEGTVRKLFEIGISANEWAALELLPLVEVAWADGKVDPPEREAILRAAHDAGIAKGTSEHALIEGWLERRGSDERLEAWISYVHHMMEAFDKNEREHFKTNILAQAKKIAESAGGFLGFNTISEAERRMLDRLESAFRVEE